MPPHPRQAGSDCFVFVAGTLVLFKFCDIFFLSLFGARLRVHSFGFFCGFRLLGKAQNKARRKKLVTLLVVHLLFKRPSIFMPRHLKAAIKTTTIQKSGKP